MPDPVNFNPLAAPFPNPKKIFFWLILLTINSSNTDMMQKLIRNKSTNLITPNLQRVRKIVDFRPTHWKFFSRDYLGKRRVTIVKTGFFPIRQKYEIFHQKKELGPIS